MDLRALSSFARVWLGDPVLALLAQPILLVVLAFVAGILTFSLFRSLGAPLLFWSEARSTRFWIGFSTTHLAAQVFFVAYLLRDPDDIRPEAMLAWFAVVWSSVVALACWKRLSSPGRDSSSALTTAIARPAKNNTSATSFEPEFPRVPPWWFLAGVGVASAPLSALYFLPDAIGNRVNLALAGPLASFIQEPSARYDLHALAAASFGAVLAAALLLKRRAAPGVGLCVLLSLLVAVYGAGHYWFGGIGVVLVVALLLLTYAGRQLYAIRIPEFSNLYDTGSTREYPPRLQDEPKPELLGDRLVAPDRVDEVWADSLANRRPLILICTSGGGIRAASWTAGMLSKLSGLEGFANSTLLVTGASGGMVGAAAWVAALHRAGSSQAGPVHDLTAAMAMDSLSDLARTWVFADVPRTFSASPRTRDRGRVLQETWTKNVHRLTGVRLDTRLGDLKQAERDGWLPSLVFSPTIIEDGRRLLISNLKLPLVARSDVRWLATTPGSGPGSGEASTSAYHIRDILGPQADDMTLATAARLSASFPYVSPCASLPTHPRTRVADAGYYDNFGVDLATTWLREVLHHQREWLEQHVSGILVLQIRDEPSELTPGPDRAGVRSHRMAQTCGERLARSLEGITGPIQGLFSTRESVMRLRNDAQLEAICQRYTEVFHENFLVTQIFEMKGSVSLSWILSSLEYRVINSQLESDGIRDKLVDVRNWLKEPPWPPAARRS